MLLPYLRFAKTKDVKTPARGDPLDAGYDFFIPNTFKRTLLLPHCDVNIPSGIKVDVPEGYAFIAFNKSGVATKQKLQVGACVVDSSYTGEIHLHVTNTSNNGIILTPGNKLVQFILIPYLKPELIEVDDIVKNTNRGNKGFGSTGLTS